MAQKILSCPGCSASIEVPDGYFQASIPCPQCGVQVNRLSGQLYQAPPQHQPFAQQGPQGYPAQQPGYPAPPQYAQGYPGGQNAPPQYAQGYPGGQYAPPQYANGPVARKSRTGLIVGVSLAGVILAVIIGAVVWSVVSTSMELDGPWYHQISEAGGYEADFPRKPHEFSEPIFTAFGSRTLKRAQYMTSNFNFEVTYFDLGGNGIEYDYTAAARAMAEEGDAVLVPGGETRRVGNFEGRIFVLQHKNKRKTKALLLRRGDRVYIVLCENYQAGQQDAADRFIDSFKLIDDGLEADSLRPYRTVGNYWTKRTVSSVAGSSTEYVSFTKQEVIAVAGSEVTVRTTTWKEGDTSKPSSADAVMNFEVLGPLGTPSNAELRQQETITTPAGEFDCFKITMENGGTVSHNWTDRSTGLLIRFETLDRGRTVTSIEMTDYSVR